MKPKYDEVRRMLMLALGCWNNFLNTLNSPLWSKSHLPDDTFFKMILEEMPPGRPYEEIQEALTIVTAYWDRVSDSALELGSIGLRFSKPHTQFEMTLRCSRSDQSECARLVIGAIGLLDQIEFPILSKDWLHTRKKLPSPYRLSRNKRTVKAVQAYNKALISLLTCTDPIIRAGIELQLVRRGFTI